MTRARVLSGANAMTKQGPRGSPIKAVDPVVRALNTIMYGLFVHYGSLWLIFSSSPPDQDQPVGDPFFSSWCTWLRTLLLLHEYWVYLQHSNVLANPFCQRLDRQYGIALLRSNQHWAIAGTLSAYWCRETLGMFLCLPFLTKRSVTRYLVLYSLIYHTIKSRGVRQDALRRFSPTYGIMRVVIDKFYLHTTPERLLTVIRLLLQGLDTWIHQQIVSDVLLSWPEGSMASINTMIHGLFAVWVLHAALNQYFQCSTASVMVQAWYVMTAKVEAPTKEPKRVSASDHGRQVKGGKEKCESKDSDEETDAESVSSAGSTDDSESDEDYIVRRLLRPGRVPSVLEGRQGAATDGVDKAVRIETVATVLASLFMIGFGVVPFRALAYPFLELSISQDSRQAVVLLSYAWWLTSLLHGIWLFFFKTSPRDRSANSNTSRAQQRALVNMVDLIMLIATCTSIVPATSRLGFALAAGVTVKSYLQAGDTRHPRVLWTALKVFEFLGKLLFTRIIVISLTGKQVEMAWIEMVVSFLWATWVVSTPVPTPCELASSSRDRDTEAVADVVFLGHPAELIDCWALWLLPYSLGDRWTPPFWAIPLWPMHYAVGWYVCNYRQTLLGDKGSFFCCDNVNYGGTRMQTWTAAHFGRHFVTHPLQVKRNIEAAARHAERQGVKVLCLGALNKAESINGGGVGVVKALGIKSRLSVIHGNHLTAAAVVETTYQCLGEKAKVFLTGASSKVGWAVAQALRDRYGYEVLCHSTDAGRRKFFEANGFVAAATLSDGMHFSKYWIVGKYDLAVPKLIPQNATAVVFSVPHALGSRSDVRVVEAGTLHMDIARLDRPRQFTNKLKAHEIFACHAASVVAAHRLKRDGTQRIVETGPVDPNTMDEWLKDAKELGFQVPYVHPVLRAKVETDTLPVVIVGAGPSGLAVAASLARRNVPSVILEAQEDPTQFGSWENHFSGLEVTSQKKWCNLPGFSMFDEKEFPGETITAENYRRYLQIYSARFGLEVRRGIEVVSVDKGTSAQNPWTVQYLDRLDGDKYKTMFATAVVVATGKHRVPLRDTSDCLSEGLVKAGIPFVHTVDLKDDRTWRKAIEAAQRGTLAIIGFGNSAADVATVILKQCHNESNPQSKIHIAARTIPPVFPRRYSVLRVDTIGYYFVRWLPSFLEDWSIRLLWWYIPSSRSCNAAFPSHLKRWGRVQGRVPVIDKHGIIAASFASGRLVGHGPVQNISKESRELMFEDCPHAQSTVGVPIEMVVFATGYQKSCLIGREDRLNGLYLCGFGSDRLLPLQSIGEQAQTIAKEIELDHVAKR